MTENQTSAFLGKSYFWSKVALELDDVQPLHGGIRVKLPSWSVGQAYVTKIAPGGKETKYRILLWQQEKDKLCRLCVEQDFMTIAPENRPGLPDEARPTITLTNHAGEKRTVTKWAGVPDDRFDAIYTALWQIGEKTRGKRPIPRRFRPYQKALYFLGLAFLIVAALFLANRGANVIVARWWPAHPGRLAWLMGVLIIGLPLALLGLRWWERKRAHYDRMGTNIFFLILVNLLIFVGLVSLPVFLWRMGLLVWGETAVAQIQSRSQTTSFDIEAGWLEQRLVTYTFQLETGESFTRELDVSPDYYEALAQMETMDVHYLPISPRFSLPRDQLMAPNYATLLLTVILAVYILTVGAGIGGKTIIQTFDERF